MEYARIKEHVAVTQEPTTMLWGNRAMLLIDPGGNRINLYSPATAETQERFRDRPWSISAGPGHPQEQPTSL